MLNRLDSEASAELKRIQYASCAVMNLIYNRADIPHPLDGFGFVVPRVENRTIMACSFASVKFPGRCPQEKAVLRVFVGGALQQDVFELTDEQIECLMWEDLHTYLGLKSVPLLSLITRYQRAMPQYNIGHVERVNNIRGKLGNYPGIAVAGSAFEGVGIPDCIASGQRAAESVVQILQKIAENMTPPAVTEGSTRSTSSSDSNSAAAIAATQTSASDVAAASQNEKSKQTYSQPDTIIYDNTKKKAAVAAEEEAAEPSVNQLVEEASAKQATEEEPDNQATAEAPANQATAEEAPAKASAEEAAADAIDEQTSTADKSSTPPTEEMHKPALDDTTKNTHPENSADNEASVTNHAPPTTASESLDQSDATKASSGNANDGI
jgi:hypothetical protein